MFGLQQETVPQIPNIATTSSTRVVHGIRERRNGTRRSELDCETIRTGFY